MDAVAGSINCLYAKFCQRNPKFHGNVSLAGHSLGSLILFDLLQHQRNDTKSSKQDDDDDVPEITELPKVEKRPLRRKISQQNYAIGRAGTGQPYIRYPQLNFKPKKFFALGSPIGKCQFLLILSMVSSKVVYFFFDRNVCNNTWY